MQMVSGALSGGAHLRDDVPGLHFLSLTHKDLGAVTVQRDQPAAVINGQVIAVTGAAIAHGFHCAVPGRPDCRALGGAEINAGMSGQFSCDGVGSPSEF